MSAFAEFTLIDGRTAFVRRDAVESVYDMPSEPNGGPVYDVESKTWGTSKAAVLSHIVMKSGTMPVPYTAAQAMEILFG